MKNRIIDNPNYESHTVEPILWWISPLWIFAGLITAFNSYFYTQYRGVDFDMLAFGVLLAEFVAFRLFVMWYKKKRIKTGAGNIAGGWITFFVLVSFVQYVAIYTASSTVSNMEHYDSITDFKPTAGVDYVTIDKYEFIPFQFHLAVTQPVGNPKDEGRMKFEQRSLIPMGIGSTIVCWLASYNTPYSAGQSAAEAAQAVELMQDLYSVYRVATVDTSDIWAVKMESATTYTDATYTQAALTEAPILGNYVLIPMEESPSKTIVWIIITSVVFLTFIWLCKWSASFFMKTRQYIQVSEQQYQQLFPDGEQEQHKSNTAKKQ